MRFYLRALRYFRDDLPLIILSLVLIAFSTLANVVQPLLVGILITICLGQFDHTWGTRAFVVLSHALGFDHHALRQVLLLAGLSVGLRIAQELLAMAQRLINVQIGYNGLMRVRCDLFEKLQQLSLAYHKSQPQGDAIYRLSYDATGFQTILTVFVNSIVVSLCTLLFMTVIMVQINWKLALITLSVAPLLLWVTKLFAGPLKRRWLEAKDVDSKLTTVIQRSVASIGLVQAFGREADEFSQFQNSVLNSNRANIRQAWQDSFYWLTVGTIFGIGYALIFGYGGWLILHSAFTDRRALSLSRLCQSGLRAPPSRQRQRREHPKRRCRGSARFRSARSRPRHQGRPRCRPPPAPASHPRVRQGLLRIPPGRIRAPRDRRHHQTRRTRRIRRLQRRGQNNAAESHPPFLRSRLRRHPPRPV